MSEIDAGIPSRILLVDAFPICRLGLEQLIRQTPSMEVCGEADCIDDALDAIPRLSPDLTILELSLGKADGLELIKNVRARWPSIALLVFSMFSERVYAERSIVAGAHGYVAKSERPETVSSAIKTVLSGDVHLSADMRRHMLRRTVNSGAKQVSIPLDTLSDRELAVLRLIGSGLGTREIASELNLSGKTIETHRERLKQKLGLSSAPELSHYASVLVSTAYFGYS